MSPSHSERERPARRRRHRLNIIQIHTSIHKHITSGRFHCHPSRPFKLFGTRTRCTKRSPPSYTPQTPKRCQTPKPHNKARPYSRARKALPHNHAGHAGVASSSRLISYLPFCLSLSETLFRPLDARRASRQLFVGTVLPTRQGLSSLSGTSRFMLLDACLPLLWGERQFDACLQPPALLLVHGHDDGFTTSGCLRR